jgi:hypothetical protein
MCVSAKGHLIWKESQLLISKTFEFVIISPSLAVPSRASVDPVLVPAADPVPVPGSGSHSSFETPSGPWWNLPVIGTSWRPPH